MSKRAQAAVEFLLLFGFMLLVFTVAYLIIQERATQRNAQAGVRELASIGHAIAQEVALASRVHDGYNRTFDLPLLVTSGPYTITLVPAEHPSEVILNDSEAEFVVFLPVNLTAGSAFVPGANFISRTGGNITTGEARGPVCEDTDGDTYDSTGSAGTPACEQPNTDCDDDDPASYPGNTAEPDCERPNADQDCDGVENQYEGTCLVCTLPQTNTVYLAGGSTLSNGGLDWTARFVGEDAAGVCCNADTQCAVAGGPQDGCVAHGWVGIAYTGAAINRIWVCANMTATTAQPATGPKLMQCTSAKDGLTISNSTNTYCCSKFTAGTGIIGYWGFSNGLINGNKRDELAVAGSCSDGSDNDCDGKLDGYDDLCWNALVNSTCGGNSAFENLTAHPNSTMPGTTRVAYDWLLGGTSVLVAQYTFDVNNSAGVNMTRDYSVNGRNATFSATSATTPTWNTNGRSGSGILVFDGIDDQANVSTSAPTDAYAVEAWVRVAGTKARRSIIVRTGSSGPLAQWSHQLRINNSATVAGEYVFEHYAWDEGTSRRVSVLGTTTITWPGWYHVVGTGAPGGKLRLFVNGVEEGTPSAITTPWKTGANAWVIGAATGDGFPAFQGRIDEVRIYGRNITPEQVRANYLMGSANRTVAQEVAVGNAWTAVLYPNNGTHDGLPITSNSVTIALSTDACASGGKG